MKLLKDKTPAEIERDRKYRKEHYYRNKPYYLARQKIINAAQRSRRSTFHKSLKSPCLICGEQELCCIDFHHINPNEKKFQLSGIVNGMHSKEEIFIEVQKCVCLCSNCHRKFHAGKLALPEGIGPS